MTDTISELQDRVARPGEVRWIGLRPDRRASMVVVESVVADPEYGLAGDRYSGRSGKRHVTLIDQAHLAAVAGYLGRSSSVDPALLRRNLVTAGINLRALKDRRFRIGDVLLAYTMECHPCSRMEEALGPGGYNAMRGHGGICARVISGGTIHRGNKVRLAEGDD